MYNFQKFKYCKLEETYSGWVGSLTANSFCSSWSKFVCFSAIVHFRKLEIIIFILFENIKCEGDRKMGFGTLDRHPAQVLCSQLRHIFFDHHFRFSKVYFFVVEKWWCGLGRIRQGLIEVLKSVSFSQKNTLCWKKDSLLFWSVFKSCEECFLMKSFCLSQSKEQFLRLSKMAFCWGSSRLAE